jgi:Nif-specific regulatory protein
MPLRGDRFTGSRSSRTLRRVGAVENSSRGQRERDLYRQLLDLRRKEEIEPFLEGALALIVEVTGARRGYLELQGTGGVGTPQFWMAQGCSAEEVADIRSAFSSGVIAEAIAAGHPIVTASALTDPRFSELRSVRRNRIEAVLCAPIGANPPLGVLYLQDRRSPAGFSEEDRIVAEDFADTVAVFADRLLIRRQRRDEDDPTKPYRKLVGAERIVGRSAALAKTLRAVSLAAPLDVPVLFTGLSGSGKTAFARLIHDNSPRAPGPFVELNCATLETLFESELFGHVRGAFTGAQRDKSGLVSSASGGTLFLDEIAEIPLASQAKLLKFLDSKEYRSLGTEKVKLANVRIIAATNVDLKAAIAQHAFREDLYFRLEAMPILVPSLAERRDDIGPLVRHFCDQTVDAFKLPCVQPSEGALRAAEAAEWPGNIRQLSNAVQRGVVAAASEGLLRMELRHLFPESGPDHAASAEPDPGIVHATYQDATRAFQTDFLRRALESANWNVTEVAARLDLTRAHVYNLIKAFGLARSRT